MSLGEAFIDIRANTGPFKADLTAQLKPILADLEAQVRAATAAAGSGSTSSVSSPVASAAGAQTEVAEAAKQATDAIKAESAAYAEASARARTSAAEQIEAANSITAASATEIADRVKAETAAYAEISARSKTAAAQQIADLDKVAVAAEAASRAGGSGVQFSPASPSGIAEFQSIQAKVAEASKDAAAQQELAFQATTKAAQEAAAAQAQASKDAADEAELDFQATTRQAEIAYAAIAQASKDAADEAELDFNATQAVAKKAAAEVAAAWDAAYTEVAARAKAAAAEQAVAAKGAADAANRAGAEAVAKTSGLSGIGSSIAEGAKSISGDVFGAVTTSAKYATIGVAALGAALIGIGLVAATKIQNARVSFTALAANIQATGDTTDSVAAKVDKLNDSVTGLSDAQRKVIGDDFTQTLIDIANNSSLAQSTIFDVSQQLLAIGLNGTQAKDVILTFGNALAASGKNGGQLNEDLAGVVTAISQISGAGRLLAQDLNQITTRLPGLSRLNVYKQIAADTKHLGDTSKVTAADIAAVRKQIQGGGVDSATATKAILEATQKIPGFGGALQRQNATLAGQIEALKDNVRNALANIFAPATGDSLTDNLAKQVGTFNTVITKALSDAAPKFKSFITDFAGALIAILPPLVTLSAKLFGVIADGISAIAPKLPAIIDGFKQVGDEIGKVVDTIGPGLTDLFNSVAGALPEIGDALGAIVTAAAPTLNVLAEIASVVIDVLAPALKGAAAAVFAFGKVLGAINTVLTDLKVFDALRAFFNNGVVQTILEVVGAFAAFFGAFAAGQVVLAAASAAVGVLAVAFEALTVAILANPVGAIIAALAALVVGFTLAWKSSETFRDIVTKVMEVVAHILVAPIQLFILSLQKMLDALATVAHAIGKFPGIPDLSGPIKTAANALGGLNSDINSAIGAIGNLAGANTKAASTAEDLRSALEKATGQTISAAANATELASILATLPEQKQIDIEIAITTTIGQQNDAALAGKKNPITGAPVDTSLDDATGFSTAGIEDAANKAAAAAKAASTDVTNGFIDGLPTGSNTTADAAVQSAAQKAASTFKQALKDIVSGLDTDFKNSLINGTSKQIDTALDSLSKKIAAAFKAAGKSRPDGLINDIQKDNTKLKALADQRAKIADQLKAATARFDEVKSAISDFASVGGVDLDALGLAATSATTKLADLSRLRIIKPGEDALNLITGGTDAIKAQSQSFADALQDKLNQITAFQANVKKLIAEGLNKTTIDQIVSAGPDGGGALAGSLATASAATVAQINNTQKGIDKASTDLANTAVDSLFRTGKSVVDGLIQGLKDKDKDLKAAMKTLADTLVDEVKKQLKIHSPSRRMGEEVGAHIIPGIVGHMDHAPLRAAMADVADTLTGAMPKLAPIDLTALTGMAQVQAKLQLDAALAPSSVQLLAPNRDEVHLSDASVGKVADAILANPGKHYNTPVTINQHSNTADPHAAAKALQKIIGGLR